MPLFPAEPLELHQIDLSADPVTVARGLRHLGGLVFFDSAGHIPDSDTHPLSIIGARPVETITSSASDLDAVEKAIAQWQVSQDGDSTTRAPVGAACGMVDYDGAAHFGIYPELMIYDHRDQTWWESGQLSQEIQTSESSPIPEIGDFTAEMSRFEFLSAVEKAQSYIAAGDIYQVNLSQRFFAECSETSLFGLYEILRESSPAPMAAYLDIGGREVLSSSPETFLRFSGKKVETRPIKGTRPRYSDPEKDRLSAKELVASEKETAELIMITDLERNDLGQFCEFGSVHVTEMLKLERYEHVHHLASTIHGQVRGDVSQTQAFAASFPGGSITGAPKKRASEIIAELEPSARGVYTGAIGYFGFNGESQFNIAIRSIVREKNTLTYHVGAGIVSDSIPAEEYSETLQKATGLQLAIQRYAATKAEL